MRNFAKKNELKQLPFVKRRNKFSAMQRRIIDVWREGRSNPWARM